MNKNIIRVDIFGVGKSGRSTVARLIEDALKAQGIKASGAEPLNQTGVDFRLRRLKARGQTPEVEIHIHTTESPDTIKPQKSLGEFHRHSAESGVAVLEEPSTSCLVEGTELGPLAGRTPFALKLELKEVDGYGLCVAFHDCRTAPARELAIREVKDLVPEVERLLKDHRKSNFLVYNGQVGDHRLNPDVLVSAGILKEFLVDAGQMGS